MQRILRRNPAQSRAAVATWFDDPKHKNGPAEAIITDDPTDEANRNSEPTPITGWRETPDGWVEEE